MNGSERAQAALDLAKHGERHDEPSFTSNILLPVLY